MIFANKLNLTTYCDEPTPIARSWPNRKGQTTYLAIRRCNTRELSRKVGNGELSEVIEGGFLSNQQLLRIEFDDEGETITSSSTDSQYDTSLFRLRPS